MRIYIKPKVLTIILLLTLISGFIGVIAEVVFVYTNEHMITNNVVFDIFNPKPCLHVRPVGTYLSQSRDHEIYDVVTAIGSRGFGYRGWEITSYNNPPASSMNLDLIAKKKTFLTQFGWPFLCCTTFSLEAGLNKMNQSWRYRINHDLLSDDLTSYGLIWVAMVADVLMVAFPVAYLLLIPWKENRSIGRFRRVSVSVAFGLWIPIIIGWGCYIINPTIYNSTNIIRNRETAKESVPFSSYSIDASNVEPFELQKDEAFGIVHWSVRDGIERDDNGSAIRVELVSGGLALGWPFISMVTNEEPRLSTTTYRPNRFDIVTKTPMQIYVRGYLVDVIFYTVIAFVVFWLPGMVRRYVRRRRGLCVACGYPIGVSERCSECGHVIGVGGFWF